MSWTRLILSGVSQGTERIRRPALVETEGNCSTGVYVTPDTELKQ